MPNPNTFANNPLDRASEKRTDPDWLAAQIKAPSTLIVPFWDLKPMILPPAEKGGAREVGWLRPGALEGLASRKAVTVFLGQEHGEKGDTSFFAVDLDLGRDPEREGPLAGFGKFHDLRAAAMSLPATEAAIMAQAKSMIDWHKRHGFCAVCGAGTEIEEGGYKRQCPSCGAEHFPRTDPVVISLVVSGDKCLMGRGPQWPKGMFSALAGFLEPGETVEEAVAREIMEETAVKVGRVDYQFSQPWPFPSSLMMGCIAELADGASMETKVDGIEIAEARWFAKGDIRAALAGGEVTDENGPFMVSPPLAIAHQLLKVWVGA